MFDSSDLQISSLWNSFIRDVRKQKGQTAGTDTIFMSTFVTLSHRFHFSSTEGSGGGWFMSYVFGVYSETVLVAGLFGLTVYFL